MSIDLKKHATEVRAYLDGETIQFWNMQGNWIDCGACCPNFSSERKYRVKPPEPMIVYVNRFDTGLGKFAHRTEKGATTAYRSAGYSPEQVETVKFIEVQDEE